MPLPISEAPPDGLCTCTHRTPHIHKMIPETHIILILAILALSSPFRTDCLQGLSPTGLIYGHWTKGKESLHRLKRHPQGVLLKFEQTVTAKASLYSYSSYVFRFERFRDRAWWCEPHLKASEVGQGRILAEVGGVGGGIGAAGGHLGALQGSQDALLPGAPEVLHVVVGAAGQTAGDLGPLVAQLGLHLHHQLLLFRRKLAPTPAISAGASNNFSVPCHCS